MIKQFIRDFGIYGLSGTLTRTVTFLLIPFYVRALSTEDYGIIDLITLISTIAGVVLSLEIYQAVARFFPGSEEEQKKEYASTGLYFFVGTYLVFAAGFYLFAAPLGEFVFNMPGKEKVLQLAVGAIFINAVFNYFQTLSRYSLRPVQYSVANILYSLSTIGASIYFVLVQRQGLEGVYLGQMAGGVLGLAVSVYFNAGYIALRFNPTVLRKMLHFSVPLVSSALAVYALTYVDRILIQRFLSLSELGIYGVSFRIASIPVVFMGIVNSSFVPLVYNKFKNEGIKPELEKIYRYTFFLGFGFITLVSMYSPELLRIITTPEYLPAVRVLPFLLLSGFLMQFANMFLGLSIANKTKITGMVYVAGLLISMACNLLLIPRLGIMGAGITSALVSVIIFLLQLYFSQKHYPIPVRYKPFISCALLSVGFVFPVLAFEMENAWIGYVAKAITFGLYSLICYRLFKNITASGHTND